MAGKFLDDPTIPTLTVSGISGANDRFLVHDDSANSVAQVVASQILDRLMSGSDISWMASLATMGLIDAANDRFAVWDASASAWKQLPAQEIIDRILTTADVSALSPIGAWANLDHAADMILVWDASANSFKTMFTDKLQQRMLLADSTTYTTTPHTLTSGQSGLLAINVGSGVDIVFTLPAAAAGLRFSFIRRAAQYIRIVPNGTNVIGEGGAGKYLQMQSQGRIDLEVVTGTTAWVIQNASCLYEYQV